MSQIFDEEGKVVPVTIIEAGPVFVLEKKEKDGKDGYDSLLLGYEKTSKVKKTMKGREYKHLKEFRGKSDLKKGEKIDVSSFAIGDKVKVQGLSKGKGFTGVVKKWNFSMQPATHGNKHTRRAMGSVGGRFPQRVVKGRKMPGRMGFDKVTLKNLKIAGVDLENNRILLKGAVPGSPGTLLKIIKT